MVIRLRYFSIMGSHKACPGSRLSGREKKGGKQKQPGSEVGGGGDRKPRAPISQLLKIHPRRVRV